jgi:hypothetical protein
MSSAPNGLIDRIWDATTYLDVTDGDASWAADEVSVEINRLIENAEPPEENVRHYIGASAIGSECLRKVQFDWMCDPAHLSRTRDIFRRGNLIEELTRQHLIRAGFVFAPAERLGFKAADGLFRGHADGILVNGPDLPGTGYPCLWEHKCLGNKGWRALERDGLVKTYPQYHAQCQVYMAYLDVTPTIFTAVDANTMERLHLLVPFDAERAQAWSDRAVTVIQATIAGELLPRGYDDRADWRCKMCSHTARCWEAA